MSQYSVFGIVLSLCIFHRKKQKVSGAFLDQSIEQLNDVTAVSGVDLRVPPSMPNSGMQNIFCSHN